MIYNRGRVSKKYKNNQYNQNLFIKIMQKYDIKVYGNDRQAYDVADFVAAGKTHKDAVGIIFGTPIIGLRVLAFDCSMEHWGKTDNIVTDPHNESKAVQILCGLEDTKRIVEGQCYNDEMTAAKWCWQYRIGELQWYLPSLMELGALFLVRDQINDAMKQLGCSSDCLLPKENSDETDVWSSSEYSHSYSWHVYFRNGYFNYGSKSHSYVVRAVAAPFPQTQSPNMFSGEAKSKDSEISDEELVNLLRSRGYSGELTKTLTV